MIAKTAGFVVQRSSGQPIQFSRVQMRSAKFSSERFAHPRGLVCLGKGLSVAKDIILRGDGATPFAKRGTIGGGAALGNNAIFGTPPCDGVHAHVLEGLARRQRHYQLQSVVRQVVGSMKHLIHYTDESTGEKKEKSAYYRVRSCLFVMQSGTKGIKVHKTNKGAAYSGLQVCGSVWHCPVCAARITNQRRKELFEVITAALEQGYKCIMVTLTARHHAHTWLEEQLEAMLEAHRSLWRGAPASRFKVRFEIFGVVRNLEVTYSRRNGWHPHMHLLVFVPVEVKLADFERVMRQLWKAAADKHGLTMNGYGFKATDADSKVADYIAKYGYDPSPYTLQAWKDGKYWNEADELTRWHTKRGKKGQDVQEWGMDDHFTPWQLLEYFEATGDVEARRLFRQYVQVFHGKQQIHGLGPLRKKLGLSDALTDQEAAEQQQDAQELLEVDLTWKQWLRVRETRVDGLDGRSKLLDIVDCYDVDGILDACLEAFGFVPVVRLAQEQEHSDRSTGHDMPLLTG